MADSLDLMLVLKPEGADEEEIDSATRNLYTEIQDLPIDRVSLGSAGEIPKGAKAGEFVALGTLGVTLAPVVVPALLELIKSWLGRKEGRTVVIRKKVGDSSTEIEIKSPMSAAAISALVKDLSVPE